MGLECVVLSSSRVRDWLCLEIGESCLFEAGPIVGWNHSAFLKSLVCDAWTAKVAGDLGTKEGFRCGSFTSFYISATNSFCSSLVWERDKKASRGAYWREGSGMAVSSGRSEAKSFHVVSAAGRMGMVCGPGVFFRMAVLQLSWMMTPRWQRLRVTPRLRVRSLRPKAEIVRQQWAFSKSGAQVDTRLVHLSLAVTSFVVGCCGVLDSLWSGCVGLHSARLRPRY